MSTSSSLRSAAFRLMTRSSSTDVREIPPSIPTTANINGKPNPPPAPSRQNTRKTTLPFGWSSVTSAPPKTTEDMSVSTKDSNTTNSSSSTASLEDLLATRTSEKEKLEKKLVEVEEALKRAQADLAEETQTRALAVSAKKEADDVKDSFESAKNKAEKECSELKEALEKSEKKSEKLEEERLGMEKEKNEEIRRVKEERDRQGNELSRLRTEKDDLESEVRTLRDVLKEVERQFEDERSTREREEKGRASDKDSFEKEIGQLREELLGTQRKIEEERIAREKVEESLKQKENDANSRKPSISCVIM